MGGLSKVSLSPSAGEDSGVQDYFSFLQKIKAKSEILPILPDFLQKQRSCKNNEMSSIFSTGERREK